MTAPRSTASGRDMIAIEGVSKHFGSFTALNAVSLTIGEGEFFSLLGPSGCGKTTLLRLLSGFQDPSEGTIAIDGKPMAGVPANQRPTNLVFQSYAIFPHLNVKQNVGYGLRTMRLPRADAEARIEQALAMVELTGLGDRSASQLSGGQRQRVALARALILEPKVLLLDEPLSALDKNLREHMQVELRRLQRAVGITFVLVTHDQHEAMAMSDRIAVMFGGRIAQIASPRELYERPASRQVAAFIGGMNFFTARQRAGATGAYDTNGLGTVELPPGLASAANSEVILGLRPEQLRLTAAQPAGVAVPAQIDVATFYGENTYYYVTVAGRPEPITVSVGNSTERSSLSPGQAVWLSFDPRTLLPLAP